jgi:hypothetical protein
MTTNRRLLQGISVGLAAASIGALYTVFARWGMAQGMEATDMTSRGHSGRPQATQPCFRLLQ